MGQSELGLRIKARRKELKLSVETVAKELGVSFTTVYRYENASIEKIPVDIFDKLCKILKISPEELKGEVDSKKALDDGKNSDSNNGEIFSLPKEFDDPTEAMEFILKLPVFANYGGYDPSTMTQEQILSIANEILEHLGYISYKYNKGKDGKN